MKIKLSICTQDTIYAERILNYFDVYYKEQIALSIFTEKAALLNYLKENKVHVILLGQEMLQMLSCTEVAAYASVGIITDEHSQKESVASIFKYQKAEQIYKQILGIYYDGGGEYAMTDGMNACIYVFLSVKGGSGATTVANAFVRKCNEKGKTLYLNLEQYGQAEKFYGEEGTFTLGDVIYAAKSKTGSLPLKLESAVRQSKEGICYYASCQNPTDLLEVNQEEMTEILKGLAEQYQTIVIDLDSNLGSMNKEVLKRAHKIILVNDGSETAKDKFFRYYKSLYVLEQQNGIDLLSKLSLIYNKFDDKSGIQVEEKDITTLGGIPPINNNSQLEIINYMANMNIFHKLLDI